MPITIHPSAGQILLCDFSQGFKVPEMIKNRPVVVLVGAIKGRNGLVTIAPLSTVEPTKLQLYHYKIPRHLMPMLDRFQGGDSWLKGDMVYTVGFHRLNLIRLGKRGINGKREYFKNKLSNEHMRQVRHCVLHGLRLGHLGLHL